MRQENWNNSWKLQFVGKWYKYDDNTSQRIVSAKEKWKVLATSQAFERRAGANVIKLFLAVLMNFHNKLDCLSLTSFFTLF